MEGVKTVVLFGACADFAGEGSVECVLVSPLRISILPAKT